MSKVDYQNKVLPNIILRTNQSLKLLMVNIQYMCQVQ